MKGERTISSLGREIRQLSPMAVMMEIDGIKIEVGERNKVDFPIGDIVDPNGRTGYRNYYSGGVSINSHSHNLTERQIRLVKQRCNEVIENTRKVYVDFLAQFAPEGFLDVLAGKPPFDILYQQTNNRLQALATDLPEPFVGGEGIDGMILTWVCPTVSANGTLVRDEPDARPNDKETEVATFVFNNQQHVRRGYRNPAWTGKIMGGYQSLWYFSTHFQEFIRWYAEMHVRMQAFTKN